MINESFKTNAMAWCSWRDVEPSSTEESIWVYRSSIDCGDGTFHHDFWIDCKGTDFIEPTECFPDFFSALKVALQLMKD